MHRAKRKRSKGFTLVELLICLAVMGLLVALFGPRLVNASKGSSVNQAAVKIYDDMRVINDAADNYFNDKTAEADDIVADLVQATPDNYIKAEIDPPAQAKESTFAGTYEYALDNSTYNAWKNAANNDTVLVLAGVTQEVCQKVNEKYAGYAEGAAIPAAVVATKDLHCFGGGPSYTVVKPIYVH